MLPNPTFSFTIPSIHDDIALDCRIYNPPHSILDQRAWSPRGAVIAHPYAPLGGCYDDPVVLSAGAEILREGFVVGTFNFRGAGASKGRTSWQAKAELDDYVSFAGLFIHYVEGLRTSPTWLQSPGAPESTLLPIPSADALSSRPVDQGRQGMTLVLGGYSYGGLITAHLPATEDILSRFETVSKGSTVAEIRLRAGNLAAQWNKDAKLYSEAERARSSQCHERLKPPAGNLAIALGGDEPGHGSRRASFEEKRSLDAVRRSMDRSRQKLGLRPHSHDSETLACAVVEESLVPMPIPPPRTCYLLISPPLPPISAFVTMFSRLRSGTSPDCERRFVHDPTFAIYGDSDFFTSQKKYRRWAENLKAVVGSQLQFEEVPGAGHFFREDGTIVRLRRGIRDWVQSISDPHSSSR